MEYTVRELRIGDRQDAEKLAAMWNASDAGWPGGWTGGIPETAERVLERTQKADRIAMFVVEVNDEIVGYADMSQARGRNEVADLPLLNVRPDCHGRGLGKALILKVLERTIKQGYQQLTLGTWAGNLKAVPLYKRTGFFWVPESQVWMQNYIPTAVTMPIARSFFSQHDWYRCFRREVKVEPDDIEWQGIKVYPYRFEEDGDLFALWIDKQSEMPTAVETNDLYLACVVGKEEVVCGLQQSARWEIVNKNPSRPLQIALMAEGEPGVGLRVVESLLVENALTLERPYTVSPEIQRKERGLPTHQIKSTVIVNGVPVTLGSAVNPVQPVEIEFRNQLVVPAKPNEKVVVTLRSRLDQRVEGELLIAPHPALQFDRLQEPFSLEPGSWTSCTFFLQADEPGVHLTRMQVVCPADHNPALLTGGQPLVTRAQPVHLGAFPLDSLFTWQDEENESVTIEAPHLWVRVNLRGGEMMVHERISGHLLMQQAAPSLGPPFVRWRQVPPFYTHRLEQGDGKVRLTLVIPSDNLPGWTIERTITVGAGPFIKVDHLILNTTEAAHAPKLQCSAWSNLRGRLTAPLRDGLLHEVFEGWGGFPQWGGGDLTRKSEDYAENWFAVEDRGLVAGLVWNACEEQEMGTLQIALPSIAPLSVYQVEPYYLVAARGNWEVVRQLWRWLQQPSTVREDRTPTTQPVLSAHLEPSPLLITTPQTSTHLVIHNRRGKVLRGRWQVEESALALDPSAGEILAAQRGQPSTHDLAVTTASLRPQPVSTTIIVTEEATTHQFDLPMVVLGDARRPVTVTPDQEGAYRVDNGLLAFTVAPAFLGAMTALERGGVNHLYSSYPEAGPHAWFNPWFGGVHLSTGWGAYPRFVRERFVGEPVERIGKRGLVWQGVRVGSDLQHKDDRWLRMEAEYLTTGGSNVVALIHRASNRTSALRGTQSGLWLWLAVGGGLQDNVLYFEQRRPTYQLGTSTEETTPILHPRRRTEYELEAACGRWAAVANPPTGDALAFTVSHPRAKLEALDQGRFGISLIAGEWLELEPGETRERVCWLAVCDTVEEARAYQMLGELEELP